jgi:hypothetical protein
MAEIVVGGQKVVFDDADQSIVSEYQWHIHRTKTVLYLRGYIKGKRAAGLFYLHRILTSAQCGMDVDHANGNGLDNRRANLRVCSRTENNANRRVVMSATGIKGVHFETSTGKWRAEIHFHGIRHRLGRFSSADRAAAAYAQKAKELFGEFANAASNNADSNLHDLPHFELA